MTIALRVFGREVLALVLGHPADTEETAGAHPYVHTIGDSHIGFGPAPVTWEYEE